MTWQNGYVEVQGCREAERAGECNQQKGDHHLGEAGEKNEKGGELRGEVKELNLRSLGWKNRRLWSVNTLLRE